MYSLNLSKLLTWFALSLFLLPCATAPAQSPVDASYLRTGELTVWESGKETLLGWDAIQTALKADFPELKINYKLVDARALIGDIAGARSNGILPDVVFVDNWSQGGPLVAQQRVVELTGTPRFYPSRGWWFQMSEGAHQSTARAFLRWLEDPPRWQAPRMSATGMTESDKQEATSAVLDSVAALASGKPADSVTDQDAVSPAPVGWAHACGLTVEMSSPVIRFLFGNGRFAYAAITSTGKTSGGSIECSGTIHSFLVLRKHNDGWKVLLLMPGVSLDAAVSMADKFDRLGLSADAQNEPRAPRLISPSDGESQTRFPKQEIAWQQDTARPTAYVVESRYGQRDGSIGSYSSSSIAIVASRDFGDIARMPEPFGIGMQPHRWRVWAIGKDGEVAVSEWRTVQFTN